MTTTRLSCALLCAGLLGGCGDPVADTRQWMAQADREVALAPKAAASATSGAAAASAPRWGSRPAALPPRPAGLRDPFRAP